MLKIRMVPLWGVFFAFFMAFCAPAFAVDSASPVPTPAVSESTASASPEIFQGKVLCKHHSDWVCHRQLRHLFATPISYEEFHKFSQGAVFDKSGKHLIGQAEIKNWNKHPYRRILVLAPPILFSSKNGTLPNAIKFTPVAEGSPVHFTDFVRHTESPVTVPQPVAAVAQTPLDPTEVATALPLHKRFSSVEQGILLFVLFALIALPWALYFNLKRKIAQPAPVNVEHRAPFLNPDPAPGNNAQSSQPDDVTRFTPPRGVPAADHPH